MHLYLSDLKTTGCDNSCIRVDLLAKLTPLLYVGM